MGVRERETVTVKYNFMHFFTLRSYAAIETEWREMFYSLFYTCITTTATATSHMCI